MHSMTKEQCNEDNADQRREMCQMWCFRDAVKNEAHGLRNDAKTYFVARETGRALTKAIGAIVGKKLRRFEIEANGVLGGRR